LKTDFTPRGCHTGKNLVPTEGAREKGVGEEKKPLPARGRGEPNVRDKQGFGGKAQKKNKYRGKCS